MSVSLREQIINIISNNCSRPGFDEYTRSADQILALIAKYATPTFSGEKKPPYCSHFNQDGCTQNCFECDYSTEQKEYCKCKKPWRGVVYEGKCMECGKPILAEKKEGGKGYLTCVNCKLLNKCSVSKCINNNICPYYQPKPKDAFPSEGKTGYVEMLNSAKPKDRIEEFNARFHTKDNSVEILKIKDKINTIIRHINKES